MSNTFVRASEVWVPNRDGSHLELATANYGEMGPLALASSDMTFKYDEGLPGKAWALGHPIILKHFEQSYFKRTEIVMALNLHCAVALPIFSGESLRGVVVLLCGEDETHVGAVEHWHNDANMDSYLNLEDGYYGSAEMFEWLSVRTRFGKGAGLPGLVWEANAPVVLPELATDDRFNRQASAVKVGINKGIGLPFLCGRHTHVVTLLSARDTPIARRMEIWQPDSSNHHMAFAAGACDERPNFAADYVAAGITCGTGTIGQVWSSETPLVSAVDVPLASIADTSAKSAGLHTVVALPIIHDGRVTSIVSWYF